MRSNLRHSLATALGMIGFLWAGMAAAAPPASVTGTWSILGNQTAGPLKITQSPAATQCKPIRGTIYTSDPVIGYYCPATGRIAFIRKNTRGAGDVTQAWVGNVGAEVPNQRNRMGGTFHALDAGAGSGELGEYNFQGEK